MLYRRHAEVPSSGTLLRVLSADAGLQLGLEPSFVVFDEVAIQPNDRLWNAMSLGSGTRSQPMVVGISTPGWEKDSLA
jgi:phage terminase large subunit-like protein